MLGHLVLTAPSDNVMSQLVVTLRSYTGSSLYVWVGVILSYFAVAQLNPKGVTD